MKKLLTMFCTLAVALSLSAPAFAKKKDKVGTSKAEAAASAEHGKSHEKHGKKKGAEEGKKKGQQESVPAPKQ